MEVPTSSFLIGYCDTIIKKFVGYEVYVIGMIPWCMFEGYQALSETNLVWWSHKK